ncbi:MAG: hypothetical protein EPN94_09585 [Nitrospirae bacterium]|nr:MAG: hypothetical protein EPN94_09585 [Nitrospirota bacterium]
MRKSFYIHQGRRLEMRKKLFIYCMMIFVIAALSACRRTPEQKAERAVDHIADSLELNEDQIKHLNGIKDEFMARRSEMGKTEDELLDEAIALMQSPQIEKERLDRLIERSRKDANEMIKFFLLKYAEFHDMLTPEQRAKVVEKLKKMKERRSEY